MELWCKYKNIQGGTIHQAKNEYTKLSLEERTKFCNMLVSNMFNLTDLYQMEWFAENRLNPEKYWCSDN